MPYTDDIVLQSLTANDFKTYFSTDFDYNIITDSLIIRSYNEAYIHINPQLFRKNEKYINAFLYLAAHFTVINYRTSSINVRSTGEEKVETTSSYGVTESFVIPKRFKNSSLTNFFSKTSYGQRYLSFILPAMVGNIQVAYGGTNA
jgi:hypothetical protein